MKMIGEYGFQPGDLVVCMGHWSGEPSVYEEGEVHQISLSGRTVGLYKGIHTVFSGWNGFSGIWELYDKSTTYTIPGWEVTLDERLSTSVTKDPELCSFLSKQLHHKTKDLWAVKFYQPFLSEKFPGNIALYKTREDFNRDRIVSMRPGKVVRYMFPELTDKDVADTVDQFNIKFHPAPVGVKVGDKPEDFKHAYSHTQAEMQNIYTTSGRKSLAYSCMRHDFSHLDRHPTEAYASGEFKIYWTEDARGHISSRCVVWFKPGDKPQAGPVYGTSENAIDTTLSALRTVDAITFENSSWYGAKLLKIEHENGGVIAPYLDCSHKGLADRGDYLKVVEAYNGDYDASDYSGVLGGGCNCYECDDSCDEDYGFDGHHFCEHCFNDLVGFCEDTEESVLQEDLRMVCRDGYERSVSYWVRDSNYTYIPHYDEYHNDGEVIRASETSTGDPITQSMVDDVTYIYCDMTELYHLAEDVFSLADGGYACLDWLNAHPEYQLNEDGEYAKVETEEAA